jgi:N-acetylmuramoyl-L-alanine amidase
MRASGTDPTTAPTTAPAPGPATAGILDAPSPNHGDRRGAPPDVALLHYTAMPTAEAALERLRDPAAEVSAHWLIAEDGRVWRLVEEARRAWHAGLAGWGAVCDVNSRSIGIELANPGDAPFPEPQMAALERVLGGVLDRWRVRPERVLGHACVAPLRKADPGPRFDWRRLARRGLAVWLDPPRSADAREADPAAFRAAARRFGFALPAEGGWDAHACAVARAFRDRFRPWERRGDGPLDAAAQAHLEALATRWPVAAEAAPA